VRRYFLVSVLAILLLASCTTTAVRSEQYLSSGTALLQQGKGEEAISEFDKGLLKDKANPKLLYNKAVALSSLGRTEEARTIAHSAFALYPQHLRFLLLEAQCYRLEGKAGEAIYLYEQELSLNPADDTTRLDLMNYALTEGYTETARNQANWFLTYKKHQSEAYAALAKLDGAGSLSEEISNYLTAHPVKN
jgi:Flp pilus assembly protein TadD